MKLWESVSEVSVPSATSQMAEKDGPLSLGSSLTGWRHWERELCLKLDLQ